MRNYFSDQVSNILTEYFMHSSTRPHELQWIHWQFYCCIWLFSTDTQIQIGSETDKKNKHPNIFAGNKSENGSQPLNFHFFRA